MTHRNTLDSLVSDFLGDHAHLSPKTLDTYRNCLGNFQWYAKEQAWPEVNSPRIRQFLAYLGESNRWGRHDPSLSSSPPACPSTIHHYGRIIKNLFRWALDEGLIDEDPTRRLRLGSPKCREVEPYTDKQVLAMLYGCDEEAGRHRYLGVRNKAIISLFVATGLRLKELSRISLNDFDQRQQQLSVRGKGERFRLVPINGEARKCLRRYMDIRTRGGDMLWKTDDGKAMTANGVRIMVVRLARSTGTDKGGPHRFRHYFATKFLEAGGDINSLRLLLGHTTLTMVLRYSRFIDIKNAFAEHRQYNPLEHLYAAGLDKRLTLV